MVSLSPEEIQIGFRVIEILREESGKDKDGYEDILNNAHHYLQEYLHELQKNHKKHTCTSIYKSDIIEKINTMEDYTTCDQELRSILFNTSEKLADLMEKRKIS